MPTIHRSQGSEFPFSNFKPYDAKLYDLGEFVYIPPLLVAEKNISLW